MGAGQSTSSGGPAAEKVVLAVDDSALSAGTVSWAAKTYLRKGQEVHLVQVLDTALSSQAAENAGEGGIYRGGQAVADPAAMESSRAYLAKLRDELLSANGVSPASVKLVPLPSSTATSGDIGRTISEYAAQSGADAVVIGSRGLGAFKRRMLGLVGLGSVSDYVAHHSPCTVFIHRG